MNIKKYMIGVGVIALILGGAASLVLAENTGTTTSTAGNNQTINLSCIASAVAKRESAIQSAFSAMSSSWSSALATRASDLSSAWAMTDKTARNSAVRAAWKKFQDSQKAAKKAYNDARKAAWSQFTTDRKACKVSTTGENSGVDAL